MSPSLYIIAFLEFAELNEFNDYASQSKKNSNANLSVTSHMSQKNNFSEIS